MSDYWFNPAAIPPLVTAVAMIAIGLLVLVRERSTAISVTFFFLTISIGGWLATVGAMMCAYNAETAALWARLCYVAVPLIAPALYHFTLAFLQIEQRYRRAIAVTWATAFAFVVVMVTTDWMLDGVYVYSWGFFPRLRPAAALFLLFFVVSLVSSLRHYAVEREKPHTPLQLTRIDNFFKAIAIGYAGSLDYLPAFGVPIYPIGFIAIGAFIALSARSILRYHLVDFTSALAAAQVREAIPAAVFVVDNSGVIQLANKAAAAMLGYAETEMLGRSLHGLIIPGRVDLDSHHDAHSMTWRRRDGTTVDVAVTGSRLRDEYDEEIGRVLVGVDVTELNVTRRAVEQLSKRNELILDAAADGIYGVDANDVTIFVNPAAARMLGRTPEELIGRHHHGLFHGRRFDGTPYDRALCPVTRSLQSGSAVAAEDELFWRADGTALPVDLISTPIIEHGRVTGAVITFNDLTQRRVAEEQRLAIAREQEANRAKDELLATVSHDLRTPVASVLGWVYFARSELSNTPKLLEALDMIEQSARVQSRLVDDLFDVSRMSAGKLRVDRTPLDLRMIVTAAVDGARPLADSSGILLTASIAEEPLIIDGDGGRLEQVIWNLLSNALKFTSRGGAIYVTAAERVGRAEIVVADTGVGIEPAFLPYVFERYRQADTTRGGLGLGLAIIKHVVELHDGTISVTSEGLGKGSMFTVSLPLRQAS